MSSALVRQALEFVDQDECVGKKRKNKKTSSASGSHRPTGQDHPLFKRKRVQKVEKKTSQEITDENIKKLLKLSQKVADDSTAQTIVERAVSGKPINDYIKISSADIEDTVFFKESYDKFENNLFCS